MAALENIFMRDASRTPRICDTRIPRANMEKTAIPMTVYRLGVDEFVRNIGDDCVLGMIIFSFGGVDSCCILNVFDIV